MECNHIYHRINFTGCHDPYRDWWECAECHDRISDKQYRKLFGGRKQLRTKTDAVCPCSKSNKCIGWKIPFDEYIGAPTIEQLKKYVPESFTKPETIELTQDWIEDNESKTGWYGLGWCEPEDYVIDEILDSDKFGNPILARFIKTKCNA